MAMDQDPPDFSGMFSGPLRARKSSVDDDDMLDDTSTAWLTDMFPTGKAKKRLHIHRCPKYLLVNLKRFETYPKKRKIKDMITYPSANFKIKE